MQEYPIDEWIDLTLHHLREVRDFLRFKTPRCLNWILKKNYSNERIPQFVYPYNI